jgi:nucleotide-binding universal stress UspA family protein
MGSVIVATDGSRPSAVAAEVGVAFARGAGYGVVFVHASETATRGLYADNPVRSDDEVQIVGTDAVLAQALAFAAEHGVAAEAELLGEHGTGHIAAAVVGVANARDAAAIVVGTRGRGVVAQALFGSVSHEIAELSPVPVLVVHSAVSDQP